MKPILRRLQQLEQQRSELVAADHSSGARERILAAINRMADPRRGDPDWESRPQPTVLELRRRIREAAIFRSAQSLRRIVNTLVKTTFKRLEQLERRHSAWVATTDTSGAKQSVLASLKRVGERLRADPNWESMPKPTLAEMKVRLQETLSRYPIGTAK